MSKLILFRRIEIYPSHNRSSVMSAPPEIRLVIKVEDEELVASKLLIATINMRVILAKKTLKKSIIFFNYMQKIDKRNVVIDTTSTDYNNSLSKKKLNNIYPKTDDSDDDDTSSSHEDSDESKKSNIDWTANESFEFFCRISFDYLGKYDSFSKTISDLKKSTRTVLGSQTFESLFNNEKFSDFTFIVRDQKFKVHKCLLSEASETLELLFTCGLNETVATIDCDPEIFKYFLNFIYTGSWSVDKMRAICMELYELAYRYEIKTLMKICIAFIMNKKVDQENIEVL